MPIHFLEQDRHIVPLSRIAIQQHDVFAAAIVEIPASCTADEEVRRDESRPARHGALDLVAGVKALHEILQFRVRERFLLPDENWRSLSDDGIVSTCSTFGLFPQGNWLRLSIVRSL